MLFPFATDAPTRWAFGSLDSGPLALLVPVMIGLAGVAVLAFFLAFFSAFGLLVPTNLWHTLVLVGVACSVTLLVLHPSIWIVVPLALNGVLAWIAWTSMWSPNAGA
jgi:hypothetical protein